MTSDYTLELGQRLRAVREQQGMTLAQVQETSRGRFRAGTVGTWERASKGLYADDLAAYAQFLGVDIRVLLPREPGLPGGAP